MAGWEVQIIADTVTPRLEGFSQRLQYEIGMEFDVVGADAEDFAKSIVVVRTGYLRSTIYHVASGLILELGARADYAPYVEFGTRRMAARPYMRPALDWSQQRIVDAILAAIQNGWNM
jgi:HK97 gp10 family phage protein